MNKLVISILLAIPSAAFPQEQAMDLENLPGASEAMAEAAAGSQDVQRPDPDRIIAELAGPLHLSADQEGRIFSAIGKKAAAFDKAKKAYDKSSAEEKSWRYKANEARHSMQAVNREIPDTVREYLDEEQRQGFDEMAAAKSRPAREADSGQLRPASEEGAVKPLKKRRVLRRKKAAPAAVPAAGEEEGRVSADTAPAAAQPVLRKRRRVKKKAVEPPAGGPAVDAPAGSEPAGGEAAEETDAGSYP